MKNMCISKVLVLLFIGFACASATAQCRIEWWGDSSGSVMTDETERTEQAMQEAHEAIVGAVCTMGSVPIGWHTCDPACLAGGGASNMAPFAYVCQDGYWFDGCMDGMGDEGNWDVVCEVFVQLSAFNTEPSSNQVVLIWETTSETDNAGFNIYRAENGGEYIKINTQLIPAEGASTEGASYEFIDDDVQNRKTYSYKLEDVDLNGVSTMHGSVSATPRLMYELLK